MRWWFFFAIVFFVFSINAKAEFPTRIQESISQKPKFFFDLTGYTSFIKSDWATFSGARAGLNYNDCIKFGLGVSHLNSSVVSHIHIKENDMDYFTNGSLKFTYGEAAIEYIFYNKPPWQFSIPVSIGYGKAHYNYISRTNNSLTHSGNYNIWILQPEGYAQYSIFNWIALNSSLGYLKSLHRPYQIEDGFNSITFSIGFNLFPAAIWEIIKNKKSP
jgi:hypothetical protein